MPNTTEAMNFKGYGFTSMLNVHNTPLKEKIYKNDTSKVTMTLETFRGVAVLKVKDETKDVPLTLRLLEYPQDNFKYRVTEFANVHGEIFVEIYCYSEEWKATPINVYTFKYTENGIVFWGSREIKHPVGHDDNISFHNPVLFKSTHGSVIVDDHPYLSKPVVTGSFDILGKTYKVEEECYFGEELSNVPDVNLNVSLETNRSEIAIMKLEHDINAIKEHVLKKARAIHAQKAISCQAEEISVEECAKSVTTLPKTFYTWSTNNAKCDVGLGRSYGELNKF